MSPRKAARSHSKVKRSAAKSKRAAGNREMPARTLGELKREMQQLQITRAAVGYFPEIEFLFENTVCCRELARHAISKLSSQAMQGDSLAIRSLHELAFFATEELNSQSLELRKAVAARVFGWPMALSLSPTYNGELLKSELYPLGLANKVHCLINLDYVKTKGSFLKEVLSRLLSLIAGWQSEMIIVKAIQLNMAEIKELGLPEEALDYAVRRNEQKAVEERIRTTEKIAGLIEILKGKKKNYESALEKVRLEAINLPPLSNDRNSQTRWFGVAMDILKAVTDGEFQLKRHGLRTWGGIVYRSDEEDSMQRTSLQQNIRDQMKKAFAKLIVPASS